MTFRNRYERWLPAMGLSILLALTAAATGQQSRNDVQPPPNYLRPILQDILDGDEDRFYQAFERVSQRTERDVYDASDQYYLTRALLLRAQSSPDLAPAIITLLGQIGSADLVPHLMEYARNGSPDERVSAVQALGWIGDPSALPVIDAVPNDDESAALIVDYARKAIRIKQRLSGLAGERDQQFKVISETMLEEPVCLVRADIARELRSWAERRVWPLVFDSWERWPEPEVWVGRLSSVLVARYELDATGFMVELRTRSVDGQVFGLRAIEEHAVADDVGALMELAEVSPDARVRAHAARALASLMGR